MASQPSDHFEILRRDTNQARGIGQYCARHDRRPASRPERRRSQKSRTVPPRQRGVRRKRTGRPCERADRPSPRSFRLPSLARARRRPDVREHRSRFTGKSGPRLLLRGARVGRQRHQLRIQPRARRHRRRIRSQRFLPRRGRRRANCRLEWPANVAGNGDARRNPRPASRGICAQESQNRSRGARCNRVRGCVWRGPWRNG